MNLDLVFKKAEEKNISQMESYRVDRSSLTIRIFKGKIDSLTTSKTNGLSLRAIIENKMGYISTENLDDRKIDYLFNKMAENSRVVENSDSSIIYKGSDYYAPIIESKNNFEKMSIQNKIEWLQKIEKEILAYDSRIISLSDCIYEEIFSSRQLNNTFQLNLKSNTIFAYLYVSALASESGESVSFGDFVVIKDFNSFDSKPFIDHIASSAIKKLGSKSIKSGNYPVIIKNIEFASLLESFLTNFCADKIDQKVSKLEGKVHHKIANSCVSLIEDPLNMDGISPSNFDDEGVATCYKEIIQEGVLKTYLYNLKTALKHHCNSTGNGYKASLSSPVNISYNNLYLKPGSSSFEDLMKKLENGLVIESIAGLHAGVNVVSGDFSVQASGYLVENGVLTRPINLITIAGNFYNLLNDIILIGNDFRHNLSSVGSSSVLIKNMVISGE